MTPESLNPFQKSYDPKKVSYDAAESLLWLARKKLDTLRGKKILDIACGSGKEEHVGPGLWYPALLLLASIEGAVGTGIDLEDYPDAKGKYVHIEANLIPYLVNNQPITELFEKLPSHHQPPFDLIVCTSFLENTSPTLKWLLANDYNLDEIRGVLKTMRLNLLMQSLLLGKEGTVLRIDRDWYEIRENKLVEI